MGGQIIVAVDDDVARVQLNRPEAMNALGVDMFYDLAKHMTALAVNDAVHAVVITGTGKAFCAGADLKAVIAAPEKAAEILYTVAAVLHQAIIEIRRMRKPVIAAVNGPAVGAGMSLALACDLRVMGESAIFRQVYISRGLCMDGGATYMLPRLVGMARAMEIASFDPAISAAQALDWGLATKVVPDDKVLDEAMAMARELGQRSMHAYGLVKQLMTDSFATPFEVQLERERAAVAACGGHPDGQEGMTAFAQKRKPEFNKRPL